MVRIRSFILGSLLGLAAAKPAILELTPDNFEAEVANSGKYTLVEFYTPWCTYCEALAPDLEKLAASYAYTDKVQIAKMDVDTYKEYGKKYQISGFPTLKIFDGKSDYGQFYGSKHNYEDMRRTLAEASNIPPQSTYNPPSPLMFLSDDNFTQTIGTKDVFVAFTAPWCGHCKNLAPTWELLAADFAPEESVLIVKVDADANESKETAKSEGIKSYPTLKFYPRGQKEGVPYSGARSEEALVEYVNDQAGTHRTAGGKLNDKAGLIAELDEIVAKFASGGKLAEAAGHAKKAANVLQGQAHAKYAEYYVRVFNKLQENEEYVNKELARMSKILAKGNVVPAKADDMTCKTNILAKFIEKPAAPRADDDDRNVKDEL